MELKPFFDNQPIVQLCRDLAKKKNTLFPISTPSPSSFSFGIVSIRPSFQFGESTMGPKQAK